MVRRATRDGRLGDLSMGGVDPGSARQEAERLVATVLAAAKLASSGGWTAPGPLGELISGVLHHPGRTSGSEPGEFATGSPTCCICPLCRAITALRDPSPELAERLATGVGDFAAGAASLLRAFAGAASATTGAASAAPDQRAGRGENDNDPIVAHDGSPGEGDQVWRAATQSRHDVEPEPDVWASATRAGVTQPAPTGSASTGDPGSGHRTSPSVEVSDNEVGNGA